MELRPNQDRCRYFEGPFSPYIAGGLDEEERRALAEHLHGCERCSQQFGLSWRRATSRIADTKAKTRPKARNRSGGLWVLAIASLLGVSLLGAMGLLDATEGRGLDPMQRGVQRKMDDEIARMIHVQTTLLEAVVDPMRGTRQTITHAARGHAKDFVERLRRAGTAAPKSAKMEEGLAELKALFHPLLRVRDPQPGGRNRNRAEWIEASLRDGIPPVVLVEVVAAYREVVFARITWGDRPTLAWLLRTPDDATGGDKQSGTAESEAGTSAEAQQDAESAPPSIPAYQLAFLVFGEV